MFNDTDFTEDRLTLHPLCELFPRITGGEFDALVADIAANGLREAITLFEGQILDGGNRYAACLAAGIEPAFREFEGDSITQFVLSVNLHRRHLTPGQHAAIVSGAQNWRDAQSHGGNRKSDQEARLPLDTIAKRAAAAGVSERTQKMADNVAKADPALGIQVAHGNISLPKATEKITGKRPGAKAKPADAPTAEPIESFETDLRHDLIDADRENRRLAAVVASIEATDTRRELVILHERIASLEGRLGQEMTTKNEAIKQIKYYKGILDKIAAKLNLNSFTDILGALK
jgi:hypothetical protein